MATVQVRAKGALDQGSDGGDRNEWILNTV